MPSVTSSREPAAGDRLPVLGLLALALATFLTVLTEALPAGLLPPISRDMQVPEAWIGQYVSVYALGTVLSAIPLTAATQGWRRRPLLVLAIAGFAAANSVTALSESYGLTLAARFLAGIFAGLLWALVAGYATRMAPAALRGRAMAIAMVGIPLALTVGIPAGTFVGTLFGWRLAFGLMSGLSLLAMAWLLACVPDFPGSPPERRTTLAAVARRPGVRAVLWVTLTFVLAHTILYTYVAPLLEPFGLAGRLDVVLLVFGLVALAAVWVVGALIDRRLRELTLASAGLFAVAVVVFGLGRTPEAAWAAVVIWGLGWGGAATLLQTASAQAAGEAADVAQAMLVTVWNLAMAAGGVAGGLLLDTQGAGAIPGPTLALVIVALVVAYAAKTAGFAPARSR
ncbi:MFS transporter [Caenispirillum bisanense]|uniref:Predicted arabinose efflux permease, MFS family n=1 Tax=Caenispirillum bisanense TaxID=414052 RepID=A0A286G947_9PROT|nr:MFS transporter [Caenispirillum bisanense]SOD91649.1 Predicted arabinose efflux permease, MFS family [Caenispirillum bisanense]